MIVSCPECHARYRIPPERVSARGARIRCPACGHRFVVHGGDQQLIIGGEGEPRGLNVLNSQRRAPGYDDEDDQPTTVMTAAERDALAREVGGAPAARPKTPPAPPAPTAPTAPPEPVGAKPVVAAPASQRPAAKTAAPKATGGQKGSTLLVVGAVLAALIAAAFLLT